MKPVARALAFYLPQFHPIAENDKAHGKGFTEWRNVALAQPLFPGHVQPKLPADIGFYDLRVPEVRELQATMAADHGIHGFCYWHYWLGAGRRLLERPFSEVLNSGAPVFPFALAWANHSWTGKGWMGGGSGDDITQTYPGKDDIAEHYSYLREAFGDSRYIHVDDKPLFVVYRPAEIPNCKGYLESLKELAIKDGFRGIWMVGDTPAGSADDMGFDAWLFSGQRSLPADIWDEPMPMEKLHNRRLKRAPYARVLPHLVKTNDSIDTVLPVAIPNWDTTPRLGDEAMIFYDLHPELFRVHLKSVLAAARVERPDDPIFFIRSWNEWAEGNYLEPDLMFGTQYLEVLKDEIAHDT